MENIPLIKVAMPDRSLLIPELESVLYSGMVGEGEYVYQFEKEFQKKFNLNNVLAVNSGTAALHLSLVLSGVGIGDEVLTTSMTAEPTNTTIVNCGAIPVFCDVDLTNGNICQHSARERITSKTKAICVVHYAGYPVDIVAFRKLADEFGIPLIEDCAHALGATVNGDSVGSFGDFALFSFQAIKHITTIDGGVLVVKDEDKVERAKRLRWFGLTKGVSRSEVDIVESGYKYNMNNVTAAFGLAQLKRVDELIKKHQENGNFFDQAFDSIQSVTPGHNYKESKGSYWIYTLLSDDSDKLESVLMKKGIMASKLHRPNHYHSVFGAKAANLPQLEKFYQKLLHIPCGWWLSEQERDYISSVVASF